MPDRSDTVSFGELLRQARESASLTQAALARRAGLDTSYISRLERSEGTTPRVDTASRLVYALGLSGPDRDAFVASALGRAPTPPGPRMAGPGSDPVATAMADRPTAPLLSHRSPAVAGSALEESADIEVAMREPGPDIDTRRARLELRIRELQDSLRSADDQVEDLTLQLGRVTGALQSALARQRYQNHELQQTLLELQALTRAGGAARPS